jgi:hypothetical protein
VSADPHADCSNAGKQVQCDRCHRVYRCDPWDDYYCTPDGDHACESCLVGGRQIAVIDLDAPLAEPVYRDPASAPTLPGGWKP